MLYEQVMPATTQWLHGSWPEQKALVLRQLSHFLGLGSGAGCVRVRGGGAV
ncbi:hypothetical protein CH063_15589 [Colletotrichum higginsianum]|uniref:Uncharacterized protein n=1 Tax=Colletotrichum higginsianum (strain IMI 349063) TaxID=759273 RepID=H1W3H9_COLHI|nr:hypothetical protein CH063_15589 [Colletotrichum higginsianum]